MNTGYSQIDKQEKANKLFGKTAIAKAIWIVCLPGLLAAFFAGLYSFFDQILIQKLVPEVWKLNDVYNGLHFSNINVYQRVFDQIFVNDAIVRVPNIYFFDNGYYQASVSQPVPIGYFNSDFIKIFGEQVRSQPIITLDKNVLAQSINNYQILDNIVLLFKNVYNSQIGAVGDNTSQLSNVSIIARQAVNSFQNILLIGNAAIYLVPIGAGVYYTKSISYKYEKTGRDIWVMSFWTTLILCLIASLICFIIVGAGVQRSLIGTANLSPRVISLLDHNNANEIVSRINNVDLDSLNGVNFVNYPKVILTYDNAMADISALWADQYSWIYASGFFFIGLFSLLSFMIRSEGRNIFVTVASIIANVTNVLLDFIFIKYFSLGLIGGATASVISWVVNLILYVGFVMYFNKKQATWLSFHDLFKVKFNIKIIIPIMILGLSSFIRIVGLTVMFLVYNLLLIRVSGQDFQNYHAGSTPLLILFFVALFGISDGGRPLIGYNYTNRHYKRVHSAFWWSLFVTFTYAIISYIVVFFVAKTVLVNLFNFKDPSTRPMVQPIDNADMATSYIRITMLRIVMFSITICGMMLFQGTNDVIRSYISSAIEGSFISYLVFGTVYGLSTVLPKTDNLNIWVYVSGYAISPFITSVVVLILSILFLRRNLNVKNETIERKMNRLDLMQYNFFINEAKKYNLLTPQQQHELVKFKKEKQELNTNQN
ncbi:MATE family efflux transporter [Mycoplasmoides gallisepticum]|uniref:MATE family efflux transporter n=1 Tax=Mycoplasmoides gallisepticum TaxID=2096 RepID=UPI0033066E5B